MLEADQIIKIRNDLEMGGTESTDIPKWKKIFCQSKNFLNKSTITGS